MSAISSPGHDDNPARGAAHKDARATRATHTESEDTVRNLKASESVVAAFQAVGIPSPAQDLAQIITTYVKSKTQNIPFKQMSNMTPGSGQLGTSAAEGVTLLLGSLTPMQREAMKAGVNPLDPGAVLKFADALQRLAAGGQAAMFGRGGEGGDSDRTASSAAYSRELSGGSYGALLKEGYSRAQLDQAMSYAQAVGWTDKDAIRMFAEIGPAGGELAKRFEAARKRGDQDDMAKAKKEAKEHEDNAKTDKERKEWHRLNDRFEKLDKASPTPVVGKNDRVTRDLAKPEELEAAKSVLDQLRKKRQAAANGPSAN
jgi:hypothetical protein